MKNEDNQQNNNRKRQTNQPTDDQAQSDMDTLVQNALKKRGDTAVHLAVSNNDPITLKNLLIRGLRVFNQSDADGATALHRAAENGNQECAKILLEFNADIDALNFMGQTAFHVAAEKQDYEFGKYLIKFRARKNCRSGCKKCRFFVKQIERYDKNKKEQEEHDKQAKLEESKVSKQEKLDQKLVEDMNQLNLLEEIEKCRKELGGPFFNKKENQMHKEQQEKYRQQENLRANDKIQHKKQSNYSEVAISVDPPAFVEQIRPRRQPQQQQNSVRSIKQNEITQDYNQSLSKNERSNQQLIRFQNNNTCNQNQIIAKREAKNIVDDQYCQNAPLEPKNEQLQRTISKKQKRRSREEDEEEKKVSRSSFTQLDPDSDH